MTSDRSVPDPLDLRAEARLDPALGFRPQPSGAKPRALFLTGATGFTGAFVAAELLASTDTTLYCLMRTVDAEAGRLRLRQQFAALSIAPPAGWEARVVPIPGDLGEPGLGLDPSAFGDLAAEIDTIVHLGARVNFLRPFSDLKAVNALGTQEVLRLAARDRPKTLHLLSSLAVFFGADMTPAEHFRETDVPDPARLRLGYQQSKWVAEQLVREARGRGLTASILRVGRIAGHSRTGATAKLDDLFYRVLTACLRLGHYPDRDNRITLIPVDHVARVITHLVQDAGALGQDFHITHPHPLPWNRIMEQVASLGCPLTPEAFEAWLERLGDGGGEDHTDGHQLRTLRLALRTSGAFFKPKPRFDDSNLRRRLAGTDIACPRSTPR
jgi:thioester reductase-like protein